MSKTQLIKDYLAKNPDHTFKDAEREMAKHDISANYFAMVRSKMKNAEAPKKRVPKKPGKAPVNGAASAVEFARECGGIDQAIAKLEELKRWQV